MQKVLIKVFPVIFPLVFVTCFSYSQRSGNFCLFNGEDSWIEVSDNNSIDFSNEVSMDAWVYLCDLDDNYIIVSKNHCANDRLSYYFSINRGKLYWRWSDSYDNGNCENGHDFITDQKVIEENKWTHVAVSVSSSSIEMFVNGEKVSGHLNNGNYSSINLTNVPLKIGVYQRINNDHGHFFPGKMDNLRIWNRKLSSTEVQNVYTNNTAGLQNNLVLFMDMENISGEVVKNKAGNGSINDGTVVGNPWFIDKMDFELGSDTTTCLGNSVSFNLDHHKNASILWNTGHSSFNYTIDTDGTYWAKYSLGECDIYDTVEVEIKNLQNDLIKDTVLCNQNSVTIDVPIEYQNFNWFDNTIDKQKVINEQGSYWIKNHEGNCTVIDSFNVGYENKPQVYLGNDVKACSDEPIIINVEANTDNYIWNDGSSDVNRIITNGGDYWVKSENECGSSIDSISVYIQQQVNPNLLKDTVVCHERLVLKVPSKYKTDYSWYDNSKSDQIEISESGDYWIQFQDELCTIRDSINILFQEAPSIDLPEEEVFLCKDEIFQLELEQSLNGEFYWSDSVTEKAELLMEQALI